MLRGISSSHSHHFLSDCKHVGADKENIIGVILVIILKCLQMLMMFFHLFSGIGCSVKKKKKKSPQTMMFTAGFSLCFCFLYSSAPCTPFTQPHGSASSHQYEAPKLSLCFSAPNLLFCCTAYYSILISHID